MFDGASWESQFLLYRKGQSFWKSGAPGSLLRDTSAGMKKIILQRNQSLQHSDYYSGLRLNSLRPQESRKRDEERPLDHGDSIHKSVRTLILRETTSEKKLKRRNLINIAPKDLIGRESPARGRLLSKTHPQYQEGPTGSPKRKPSFGTLSLDFSSYYGVLFYTKCESND